jgi:hypothetical protein
MKICPNSKPHSLITSVIPAFRSVNCMRQEWQCLFVLTMFVVQSAHRIKHSVIVTATVPVPLNVTVTVALLF